LDRSQRPRTPRLPAAAQRLHPRDLQGQLPMKRVVALSTAVALIFAVGFLASYLLYST
jgi:hypothetical protein